MRLGAIMKRLLVILCFFTFMVISTELTAKEGSKKIVKMGYLQNDLHQLAAFVALEKGLYKKHGVQVEVAGVFRAGPEEMTAFAARSLDFGYVGQAPATTAVANKVADVKLLAQANLEGSAIIVRRDSRIQDVRALSGMTVAIPGYSTVQDFLLRKALDKHSIDVKKVNIIVIKPPEMIGLLQKGEIDAIIAWEPFNAKAVIMGVGRILITSTDIWPNHPCCAVIADSKLLRENPKEIVRLIAVHLEATRFIRKNPDEAVRIAVKYTGMDEATIRLALTTIKFSYELNIDGAREYVEFLSRFGYIKEKDARGFIDRFIDFQWLQKALNK